MDPTAQWQANIDAANGTGDMYTNYARALRGTDQSAAAFTGKEAAVGAQNDEIARQNAEAAAKVAKQKEQDAADPSKARMELLPDNQGYAFFDGTGQRININQFSLLTGKRPDEILSDSPVAKDQKFVQDYKTLMALSNAWVNGDTETLDKLRAADPKKFNSIISSYKSPAEMVKAFTEHWSDYYGNTNKQNAQTTSMAPQQVASPDKNTTSKLAASSLQQVLQPMPTNPGPQSFLNKINPFADHSKYGAYKDKLADNPWFAYHNSLYGQ